MDLTATAPQGDLEALIARAVRLDAAGEPEHWREALAQVLVEPAVDLAGVEAKLRLGLLLLRDRFAAGGLREGTWETLTCAYLDLSTLRRAGLS